jgi:serralysin
LMGNSGNDELHDGAGNDTVDGGSGDDLVVAGEGDDSYNGAAGYDVIDFSNAQGSMNIDLSKKSAVGMGNDVLWNFEKVIGSSFDDYMKGSKSAEHLVGGDGNDVLRGLGGADTLTGGAGKDTFQWLAKDVVDADGNHLGVDLVTDFSKEDVLDFSKMFKSGSFKSINDVVKVVDDGAASHVFAAIGGEWQQVVTLEGVTGFDATTMHDNGMILV